MSDAEAADAAYNGAGYSHWLEWEQPDKHRTKGRLGRWQRSLPGRRAGVWDRGRLAILPRRFLACRAAAAFALSRWGINNGRARRAIIEDVAGLSAVVAFAAAHRAGTPEQLHGCTLWQRLRWRSQSQRSTPHVRRLRLCVFVHRSIKCSACGTWLGGASSAAANDISEHSGPRAIAASQYSRLDDRLRQILCSARPQAPSAVCPASQDGWRGAWPSGEPFGFGSLVQFREEPRWMGEETPEAVGRVVELEDNGFVGVQTLGRRHEAEPRPICRVAAR